MHSEKERGRPSQEVANYFLCKSSTDRGEHRWPVASTGGTAQESNLAAQSRAQELFSIPQTRQGQALCLDTVHEPQKVTLLSASPDCEWSTCGTKQEPAAPLEHKHPWELLAQALLGVEGRDPLMSKVDLGTGTM